MPLALAVQILCALIAQSGPTGPIQQAARAITAHLKEHGTDKAAAVPLSSERAEVLRQVAGSGNDVTAPWMPQTQ